MREVAALLLAAGRSRRMGKFKPLLPFGQTTVIEACVNSLRAAGIGDLVVVVGHRADEIRERLKDFDLTFALNPDPDSAMGVSIACGLEQVSTDRNALLVALVDHPAVDSRTISALIEEWRRGSKLVQPEYDGRGGHPVLIDLSYRPALKQLDSDRGLRALFDSHRAEVRRLPVESPYVAQDMDTWEDYVRLHADVFGWAPDAESPPFS